MKVHGFRIFGFVLLNAFAFGGREEVCAQIKTPVYDLYNETASTLADSIPVYNIGEVIISKDQKDKEYRAVTPLQIFDRKALSNVNALQVSDAVKFFSGVTVKDFGGIGGMKTVSVRSMGAHHTAVAYDGITITDCQTGQIDIGRFSLENVDMLSLNIGDGNTIFQPARMFASSGLLNIRTTRPVFGEADRFHGKVGFKVGSFGLLNPSLTLDSRLSSSFDLNFSAELLNSKGDYSYKLFYADQSDAFTTKVRSNNGVKTYRVESTLFGHFKGARQLEVKGYYYQSDRGLPGAVVLYNPYSSQHLWDKNAFLQAHYQRDLSGKWAFQANGKYNWSYQRYLNPDYLGSTGKEDNSYHQDETYLSSSLLFRACTGLSFAFSADAALNRMQSDLYGFASPTRYTGLTNLSAKYLTNWMILTANVLATAVGEKRDGADAAADYRRLSPAFNLSVQPFSGQDLRLRVFYKESFRMPSFNDLYYSAIGNTDLKPENSRQLDFGLTYGPFLNKAWPQLVLTADVYCNKVSDKIMAIPTKNIFIWSMTNLGKVDIQGLDLALSVSKSLTKGYELSAAVSHSYQRALDVTDVAAKEYRNQIAYAPRIFGSGRLALGTPWLKVAYAMLYSGHRYVTGQNLEQNDLAGYVDHSLSAEKDFLLFGYRIDLRGEVLNLLNENYEIVRNFPMPGRSFRVGLKVAF